MNAAKNIQSNPKTFLIHSELAKQKAAENKCFRSLIEGGNRLNPSENLCKPFAGGIEAGTAESVPGAVRVSGQAAVGAGRAVRVAAVQGHLGDPELGAGVQLLLQSKQFK